MGKPDRSYTLFDIIRLDKSLIVRKVELAVSRLELAGEEARDLIRKTLVKYDAQIGVYDRLVKQIKDISELGYIDTMFAEQEGDDPDWLSPVTDAKDVKRLIFKAHQAKLEQATSEPAVKLAGLSDGSAERLKVLDAESKQRGLTDQIPMLERNISDYTRDAESLHEQYMQRIRMMKEAQSEYMDTLIKIEQFKECSDDDHLIKELETIEKSFGIKAVAVTPGGWIVMITPDYTLRYFEPAAGIDKSVHVGQMCVLFRPYGNVHEEFKVFPFKDNVRKDGHIHCFVSSNGQMCFGTGFDECADHQKEGRFTALFSKFSYLMQTYKPDGPYVSFNPFNRDKVKIDTKYISDLLRRRLSDSTGSATADYALFYLLHGEQGLDAMMPDAHRWPYYPSLDGKSEDAYTLANRMLDTFTVNPRSSARGRVPARVEFARNIQAVHTTDPAFRRELELAAERYVRSELDNGQWGYHSYGAQVESSTSNVPINSTDLDVQASAHEFFGYDEDISIDDTADMRERDLCEVYDLDEDPCLLYDFHYYLDLSTRYRIKLWVNFGGEETATEILRQMYSDMRERPHKLLELMPDRFFTRRVEDEQPAEADEWCKRTDVPLGLNDLRRWLLHECYKRMADKNDVTIDSVMDMIKAESQRTNMNYGAVLTYFLDIRPRGVSINNVLQQHMNRAEALDHYQPTGE